MTRIFITLLIFTSSLMADVKSTKGEIKFKTQIDNQAEMTLNSTGLGIGVSPSTNLHVNGNAIITNQVFIGGSSGSSNLNVYGTIGYGFQTVSSNTTLGDSSIVLVDSSSDNIMITLPYAGNVNGRQYQVKKISTSNSVWISGGGNLIDDTSPIELPESNNLASVKLISDGSQWYKIEHKDLSSTVASDNLVGWWKMDETSSVTAIDSSGQNNYGTLQSLDFSTDTRTGKIKTALNFDGSTDYVFISDADSLDLGQNWSYGMWIFRQTDSGSVERLLSKDNDFDDFSFWLNISPADVVSVGFNDAISTTPNNYSVLSNETISTGIWYHIFGTYDGVTLKVYLNGTEDNNSSHSSQIPSSSGPLNIGRLQSNGSYQYNFNGIIDDVRVYNKTLTGSEIQALYNQGQ